MPYHKIESITDFPHCLLTNKDNALAQYIKVIRNTAVMFGDLMKTTCWLSENVKCIRIYATSLRSTE